MLIMPTLIITNGDSTADLLAEAGRDGMILPWRDVLHEGPIMCGPLAEQSIVRAAFLAKRLNLDPDEVFASFVERDAVMADQERFDSVELWFEHDLYDQLQLIQILSVFSSEQRAEGLTLVQADDFLGHQRPDTILRFADQARPIEAGDLGLATALWADLAARTPKPIARRLSEKHPGFPFIGPALHRFLEELPGQNGLTRTETSILAAIERGVREPLRLFPEVLSTEEAAFMGDTSFFAIVDDLLRAPTPLISGVERIDNVSEQIEHLRNSRLSMTDAGEAVFAGNSDHVLLNGIDRDWAGTRLKGHDVWRFDRETRTLVPPRANAA